MIKKGSKIVINRPLKVTEVTEGPDMTTVTVSVTYTNVFGQSIKDEIILPRKWVSEYKPVERKPKQLELGQTVRITKVLDQMLIDNGVEVDQKGIIVDIPDEGVIEVFVLEIHQGWFFTEDALAPWKEGK